MSIDLQVIRDVSGFTETQDNGARPFSKNVYNIILTASAVTTFTVPVTDCSVFMAYFRYTPNSTVWVQPDVLTTLVLPTTTASVTTATLNPGTRRVSNGQQIQLLTASSNVEVSIEFYRLIG
jgi:hypothetical protein